MKKPWWAVGLVMVWAMAALATVVLAITENRWEPVVAWAGGSVLGGALVEVTWELARRKYEEDAAP